MGQRPWWLDTMQQAEWWGNIYYCSECVTHMAKVCGLGDVIWFEQRVTALEEFGQRAYEKANTYERILINIRTSLDTVGPLNTDVLAHQDPPQVDAAIGYSEPTPIRRDEPELPGISEPVDEHEPRVDEPITSEGLPDLGTTLDGLQLVYVEPPEPI